MNWLKNNFISLIAIVISILSICAVSLRWMPFTFDSLGFFGWATAALSVLVVVLIGFQVWQVFSFENRLKKQKDEIQEYMSDSIESELYLLNVKIDGKISLLSGLSDVKVKDYNSALNNFIVSLYKYSELKHEYGINTVMNRILKICDMYSDNPELLNSITDARLNNLIEALGRINHEDKGRVLEMAVSLRKRK